MRWAMRIRSPLSVPWALGVARHKLVDHWRRQARDERRFRAIAGLAEVTEEPWDVQLDAIRVRQVLDALGVQHRAALTLDEFALWLNLKDVYWAREGRESIDAVVLFGALLAIGAWGSPLFSRGFQTSKTDSKD